MPNLVFTDNPNNWRTVDLPNVPLTRVSLDSAPDTPIAYVFFGHVNIDFDGDPTAYGPSGIDPPPDDNLQNAVDTGTDKWVGLLAMAPSDPLVVAGTVVLDRNPALEKHGKFPVVQQAANGDPSPGYYVSTLPQASGPLHLQSSYIDSSQIAFGALSGKLRALGFTLGDYGLAIRHDANNQSGFYFVDTGANNFALGECSLKVGTRLGGSGRGNSFNNNFPVSFIVFPGSTTVDPAAVPSLDGSQIGSAIMPLLANLGGADNAADLALLMAFNETDPPNRPRGTSRLATYKASSGSDAPQNAATILQGLQACGFPSTVTL